MTGCSCPSAFLDGSVAVLTLVNGATHQQPSTGGPVVGVHCGATSPDWWQLTSPLASNGKLARDFEGVPLLPDEDKEKIRGSFILLVFETVRTNRGRFFWREVYRSKMSCQHRGSPWFPEFFHCFFSAFLIEHCKESYCSCLCIRLSCWAPWWRSLQFGSQKPRSCPVVPTHFFPNFAWPEFWCERFVSKIFDRSSGVPDLSNLLLLLWDVSNGAGFLWRFLWHGFTGFIFLSQDHHAFCESCWGLKLLNKCTKEWTLRV